MNCSSELVPSEVRGLGFGSPPPTSGIDRAQPQGMGEGERNFQSEATPVWAIIQGGNYELLATGGYVH